MTSDRETIKTKVVDLKKLSKFVVDNFFIWNHLCMENYVWISEIWNSNFSNDVGWSNNQNKSWRSQNIIQLYSWLLFHLKSSMQGKLYLIFLTFEFRILQTISDGETTKTKVADLKRLWNFVVDKIFIWSHLYYVWFSHIWNSKLLNNLR
jgi:hypothetical protein